MGLLATLVIVGYTLAPTGFYKFCTEQPRQCAPVAARRPVAIREIDAVNRRVNAAIRPQPEPPGQDIWKWAVRRATAKTTRSPSATR